MSTEPYHCPCGHLGVLVLDEEPHDSAEVCKNALATTISGMQMTSVVGLVKSSINEIHIATGRNHDVLNMTGERRLSHHLRVAVLELERCLRLLEGR